jgi:hypothetical protein
MPASREGNVNPIGYEKLTGLSTAKGLTIKGSSYVLLKAEGQGVRWRDDGVNPTVSEGMLLDAGEEFWYTGSPLAIKFIEAVAGATVYAAHYS